MKMSHLQMTVLWIFLVRESIFFLLRIFLVDGLKTALTKLNPYTLM
jgi:hypothetical protein